MQVLKVGLESQNIGKRRDSLRWTRGCLKGAGTTTNRVVMPVHRKTKHDRSMDYMTDPIAKRWGTWCGLMAGGKCRRS